MFDQFTTVFQPLIFRGILVGFRVKSPRTEVRMSDDDEVLRKLVQKQLAQQRDYEKAIDHARNVAEWYANSSAQLVECRTLRADAILRLRTLDVTWSEIANIFDLSPKRPFEIAQRRERELSKQEPK